MKVLLQRFAYLPACTHGALTFEGLTLTLATIERPWIRNPAGPGGMPRESCVPDGLYSLGPHSSAHFPDTYALVNHDLGIYYQPADVPPVQAWGRTAILMHIGNRVEDVIGCIAVGMRWDPIMPHFIVDSRMAMNKLRAVLGRDRHQLEIRPSVGTR